MRINLTKKEIINSLYMQIGFSKKISEDLLDDILDIIVGNLKTLLAYFTSFLFEKGKIGCFSLKEFSS